MLSDTFIVGFSQVLILLIYFLNSILLAKNLGIEKFGTYSLVIVYASLCQIFSLPGNNISIRKGLVKGNDPIFYILLKESIFFSMKVGLLISLVSFALFFLQLIDKNTTFICIMMSLFTIVWGIDKFDNVLVGKKEFILSRKILFFNALLLILTTGLVSFFTNSWEYAIVGNFFTRFTVALIGLKIISKLLIDKKIDNSIKESLTNEAKWYNFFNLVNIIVSQIDKLIIGILDVNYLAIYNVGNAIPKKIKDNAKLLLNVPIIYSSQLSKEKNFNIIKKNLSKIILLGILCSFFVVLSAYLVIPIAFGEEYEKSIFVMQILSLSFAALFTGHIFNQYDVYQNYGKAYRKFVYFRHLIYFIMLIIFVPKYNLAGLVYTLVFIEISYNIIVSYYIYVLDIRKSY